MQEPTNQGHQTLIIGHVRMYQEYGTQSKSKTNTGTNTVLLYIPIKELSNTE